MVWSRERFYIGRPASMDVVDTIPLHEIDEVVEMDDESAPGNRVLGKTNSLVRDASLLKSGIPEFPVPGLFESNRQEKGIEATPSAESESAYRSFLAQSRLSNVLQIKTAADGVNSGRTYYMSTRSSPNAKECRQALVKQLSTQSKRARRKAEAKSRFRRSQDKVKAVQSSMPFQLCMAALIIAVSRPQPCTDCSDWAGPAPALF